MMASDDAATRRRRIDRRRTTKQQSRRCCWWRRRARGGRRRRTTACKAGAEEDSILRLEQRRQTHTNHDKFDTHDDEVTSAPAAGRTQATGTARTGLPIVARAQRPAPPRAAVAAPAAARRSGFLRRQRDSLHVLQPLERRAHLRLLRRCGRHTGEEQTQSAAASLVPFLRARVTQAAGQAGRSVVQTHRPRIDLTRACFAWNAASESAAAAPAPETAPSASAVAIHEEHPPWSGEPCDGHRREG